METTKCVKFLPPKKLIKTTVYTTDDHEHPFTGTYKEMVEHNTGKHHIPTIKDAPRKRKAQQTTSPSNRDRRVCRKLDFGTDDDEILDDIEYPYWSNIGLQNCELNKGQHIMVRPFPNILFPSSQ